MIRAVLDATALHPAPVRDLLLRASVAGLYEARLSPQIVDVYVAARLAERPDLTPAALAPTRALLAAGLPDLLVDAPAAVLSDVPVVSDDQRVTLAAAVLTESRVVLSHARDVYDTRTLTFLGIEARHPDEFLLALVRRTPAQFFAVVSAQARAVADTPVSLATLLRTLRAQGLRRTVDELSAHVYGAAAI